MLSERHKDRELIKDEARLNMLTTCHINTLPHWHPHGEGHTKLPPLLLLLYTHQPHCTQPLMISQVNLNAFVSAKKKPTLKQDDVPQP